MPESVRPPAWPQIAKPSVAPARPAGADPRAAFFGQALARAGAASGPAPSTLQSTLQATAAPAAAPSRPGQPTEAVDLARPLRPGSLLNIRV